MKDVLRNHNLRVYLSGQAVSLIGTWMQATAQSWLVWQLSHSTVALGVVAMLGTLPFLLLGPLAGAWADRLDRRKLLVIGNTAAMALAFILALLVYTGAVELWHIYLFAALLGIVNALDMPAHQAFLGDLSGIDQVRQAVMINSAIFQLSRMAGPAIAGWLIGTFGIAPAFWINGVSFTAVIIGLLAVRAQQVRKTGSHGTLADFRETIAFIRSEPRVQDLLFLSMLVTFFGISSMQFLPVFATDVLRGNAQSLGLLMGASGAGALIGSLVVAPLAQKLKRTGVTLIAAALLSGACLCAFALSVRLPFSLLWIFLASVNMPVLTTTANGLMQTLAPADMRARLISTWLMLGFGTLPFAAMLIGITADLMGAPAAVFVNGSLIASGALALMLARKQLRDWQVGTKLFQRTHKILFPTERPRHGD